MEEKPEKCVNSLETLDEFVSDQDNSRNYVYFSKIPNVCKEFPCILGIDEAGRGPVLGPMVYGTSFCPINQMSTLDTLGCDDSKALTEETRDLLFSKICQSRFMGWGVEVIAPQSICNSMFSRKKVSLNQVSMDSAIGLIRRAADAGVNISKIYVDTVGPPEKYQAYLKSLFPKYDITVSKKADSLYTIVSAASICAKVTRDHALKMWKFPERLPIGHKQFGSGYPGDPVTKKFLVDYVNPVFGFPQLVRFSWSTAVKALEETAYHVDWENVEDEEGVSKNTVQITSFFKATNVNPKKRKRHEYFSDRYLTSTSEL